MKVLHVANFGHREEAAPFYSTDHKVSAGLARCGCAVSDFSHRDLARAISPFGRKFGGVGAMNQLLIERVRSFRPDLLLLGHAELVRPKTLAELRHQHPDMRVARWWVDSLEKRKMRAIRAPLPWVDVLFTSHGVQFAADRLAEAGAELPPKLAWMPFLCDPAVENRRAFERTEHDWDLLFAARPWPSRRDLPARLRRLLPVRRLGLFGEPDNLLQGQDYMDAIGTARSALNFSIYNDAPWYSSDRLGHLAGNGTLVLSARVSGLAEMLADSGVVFFDALEELPGLLDFWLGDQRWRRAAQRSWGYFHKTFAAERTCRWLLEVAMNQPLSDSWPWQDQLMEPGKGPGG